MYFFTKRKTELLAEAQNLAVAQLAHLQHRRMEISEQDSLPFISREILRLHREGERDPQRLANRAIGRLREFIQKRESARRLASQPD